MSNCDWNEAKVLVAGAGVNVKRCLVTAGLLIFLVAPFFQQPVDAQGQSGNSPYVWGDMTVTFSSAYGDNLERRIEQVPMKPFSLVSDLKWGELFGNLQVFAVDKTGKRVKPLGNFEGAPLTITVNVPAMMKAGMKVPASALKFFFWDDRRGSWLVLSQGGVIKDSRFHIQYLPLRESKGVPTIKVLEWPADDICVGCGG